MASPIDQLKSDIDKILEYNWKDELSDYIDHPGEKSHIFHVLVRLNNFIDTETFTADEYAAAARKRGK